MTLDGADAIRIIATEEIVTLKVCFCSNNVVIIYATAKCRIDAGAIATQQAGQSIIGAN